MSIFRNRHQKHTDSNAGKTADAVGDATATAHRRLYCFVAKADAPAGVPGFGRTVVMEASDAELQQSVRRHTGHADAEVVIVEPGEWNAPRFRSTNQQEVAAKFPEVMTLVTKHMKHLGLGQVDQSDLVQHGTVMPNPVSGRILFVFQMP